MAKKTLKKTETKNLSKKKKKIKSKIQYGAKTMPKEKPYLGNYDIYFNPKPNDTVRIKYGSLADVKFTIKKLESLYSRKLRPHSRISKIANVLQQRLRVIKKNKKNKKNILKNNINSKNAIKSIKKINSLKNEGDINERYTLAKKYFEFLKRRTKAGSEEERRNMKFKI